MKSIALAIALLLPSDTATVVVRRDAQGKWWPDDPKWCGCLMQRAEPITMDDIISGRRSLGVMNF